MYVFLRIRQRTIMFCLLLCSSSKGQLKSDGKSIPASGTKPLLHTGLDGNFCSDSSLLKSNVIYIRRS